MITTPPSSPPLALFFALLLLLIFTSPTTAQSPTSSPPSSTTPAYASIVPSTTSYTYLGCYNETTGNDAAGNVRALAGGTVNASTAMTVAYCLQLCGSAAYAGLEYGRECWCSPYLNSESVKLADADCALRCSGEPTEVCGGELRLTLYQRRAGGAKKNAGAGAGVGGVEGGVGAVVGMAVVGLLVL